MSSSSALSRQQVHHLVEGSLYTEEIKDLRASSAEESGIF